MIYLALGAFLLWIGLWVYRRSPGVQRGRWRVGSGLLASVLLGAGGFMAVRGEYIPAAIVVVSALVLAGATRSRRGPTPERGKARDPAGSSTMSRQDACDILGVAAAASAAEVRAAHHRLMRMAHPDKGGTTGLAAQLNAARDRLLREPG